MRGLMEAVERPKHRLQRGPFEGEGLSDRHILLLWMRLHRGPAQALCFQPSVQLLKAGEAQPGLKEATPDRLDLVLDLPLLPARRRRTGGRLDHVVIGHDQEPAVEDALLADKHRRHRGLHVVVDPAQRHPAKKGEAARMRVEHHLLRLAWISSDIDRPRRAQPHMRHLHAHRLAGDLHVLVAPVELVGLARSEQQWDERWCAIASVLAPRLRPAPGVATDRIVRSLETLAAEKVVDPRHPQPIAAVTRLVLRKQRVEPFLKRPNPRQRLNRTVVAKRTLRRAYRLAHDLARQPQIPRNLPDRLAAGMLAPDPYNCLHHQHPDLATWKTRPLSSPSEWWFPFGRRSPRQGGSFCTPGHTQARL